MSVILYPSPDDRVEQADQVFSFGLGVGLHHQSHFLHQVLDAFLGRFDEQFVAILAHILTEKVEPVFDMCDDRFLFREFQASLTEERFHQRFDYHQQKHFRMSCDDEVIPLQARIEQVTDDSDLEEVYNTERHLLYVACTRARDHLLVTSVDPTSEFLDDLRM